MEGNLYQLMILDFKRMVRYIVGYVITMLVGLVVIITFIDDQKSHERGLPMETILIGFFVLTAIIFVIIQKKNRTAENVVLDEQGVHTNRFGSFNFTEIAAYQVFKKKRQEDLILILNDKRKISFGPVDFRKGRDEQIYDSFKEAISKRVPQKGQKI